MIGGKKRAVVVEWTQSEVITLLDEIQSVLPNDDNVKYSTMADRLEWDKVQVGHHTPAECKDQWIGITTKVVYHLTTLWSTQSSRHTQFTCNIMSWWHSGLGIGLSSFDQAVVGLIHGQGVIKSPRSTQPSIPLG